MKIFTHIVDSTIPSQIETEIRFIIASARSLGNEIVCLKTKGDAEFKIYAAIIKNLKAIKKQGKIDFFAEKEAFEQLSAEASYLLNKFPKITEYIDSESTSVIIKI